MKTYNVHIELLTHLFPENGLGLQTDFRALNDVEAVEAALRFAKNRFDNLGGGEIGLIEVHRIVHPRINDSGNLVDMLRDKIFLWKEGHRRTSKELDGPTPQVSNYFSAEQMAVCPAVGSVNLND